MLAGLHLAWFRIFSASMHSANSALGTRKDRWGILIKDDKQALLYQYHSSRAEHACEHLSGPPISLAWSSTDGDITERELKITRQHRTERKRRARTLLKPIWEREELEDLYPTP